MTICRNAAGAQVECGLLTFDDDPVDFPFDDATTSGPEPVAPPPYVADPMSEDDQWWADTFGGTFDQEAATQAFNDWVASKGGQGKDKERQFMTDYARNTGTEADYYRKRLGMDDPYGGMRDEIFELRRTAAEGLDPVQFRRNAAAQGGLSARKTTQAGMGALDESTRSYGANISSGLVGRYKDVIGQQKVADFGKIMGALMSKDMESRSQAKQTIFNLVQRKFDLDALLIQTERQRIDRLG